jgi:CrcB protein
MMRLDGATSSRPLRRHRGALMPRPDGRELAAISLGGAIGALARAGVSQLDASASPGWPWATFGVNVLGAFLLGYLATRLQERLPLSAYRRPLLGTGVCGALTTFSTVQVELVDMLDSRRYGLAAGYAAATVIIGYLAVQLATGLVRRVRSVA